MAQISCVECERHAHGQSLHRLQGFICRGEGIPAPAVSPGSGRAQVLKHQKNRKKKGKTQCGMYVYECICTHTCTYTDILILCVRCFCVGGGERACSAVFQTLFWLMMV